MTAQDRLWLSLQKERNCLSNCSPVAFCLALERSTLQVFTKMVSFLLLNVHITQTLALSGGDGVLLADTSMSCCTRASVSSLCPQKLECLNLKVFLHPTQPLSLYPLKSSCSSDRILLPSVSLFLTKQKGVS